MTKNRIILVSNRLPMTVSEQADGQFKINKSSGGLVAGLREIYQDQECLWVGHSGVFVTDPGYAALKLQLAKERLVSVDLDKADYEIYYNGACNNEIWPLFHCFPGAIEPDPHNWHAYEVVNQTFAKSILSIAKPGDKIWVHDYQLMLLPALLRKANPNLAIAYFHHIPFPSSELFRILQPRTEILAGLLGADLIGFHTYDYVRHFLTSVTRILGCSSHLDEILYQGRRVKIVAQPLGVDVKMIKQSSDNYIEQADVMQLAREIGNRAVLLGIDRLDYTKGIPERLLAYRQLLQQHPEHVGNVTFIQICVPTRTHIQRYIDLRYRVEQLVGQINGEFGAPGYVPVQYLYRSFSQDEIIAFYKLARVAVVTPLRDGLNLVCKEYVAARDDDDGVLILSEMAGAAAEMGEALLINPYNINQFTATLQTALVMRAEERHRRLVQLRQRIIEFDNMAWLKAFLQHWDEAVARNHPHSVPLRNTAYTGFMKRLRTAKRCFIFLNRTQSLPLLRDLSAMNRIELTLMTNQSKDFCEGHFNLPTINIIAEQGACIRFKHDTLWQTPYGLDGFTDIRSEILRLFTRASQCIPGSYVEQESYSLIWNYHRADKVFGGAQARDLSAAINQLLENTLFGIHHHHYRLEVRPLIANQSYAVKQILHRFDCQPDDLLVTIGDEEVHEEMYKLRPDQNISIHVGAPNLFAKYHLNLFTRVEHLLQKVAIGFHDTIFT